MQVSHSPFRRRTAALTRMRGLAAEALGGAREDAARRQAFFVWSVWVNLRRLGKRPDESVLTKVAGEPLGLTISSDLILERLKPGGVAERCGLEKFFGMRLVAVNGLRCERVQDVAAAAKESQLIVLRWEDATCRPPSFPSPDATSGREGTYNGWGSRIIPVMDDDEPATMLDIEQPPTPLQEVIVPRPVSPSQGRLIGAGRPQRQQQQQQRGRQQQQQRPQTVGRAPQRKQQPPPPPQTTAAPWYRVAASRETKSARIRRELAGGTAAERRTRAALLLMASAEKTLQRASSSKARRSAQQRTAPARGGPVRTPQPDRHEGSAFAPRGFAASQRRGSGDTVGGGDPVSYPLRLDPAVEQLRRRSAEYHTTGVPPGSLSSSGPAFRARARDVNENSRSRSHGGRVSPVLSERSVSSTGVVRLSHAAGRRQGDTLVVGAPEPVWVARSDAPSRRSSVQQNSEALAATRRQSQSLPRTPVNQYSPPPRSHGAPGDRGSRGSSWSSRPAPGGRRLSLHEPLPMWQSEARQQRPHAISTVSLSTATGTTRDDTTRQGRPETPTRESDKRLTLGATTGASSSPAPVAQQVLTTPVVAPDAAPLETSMDVQTGAASFSAVQPVRQQPSQPPQQPPVLRRKRACDGVWVCAPEFPGEPGRSPSPSCGEPTADWMQLLVGGVTHVVTVGRRSAATPPGITHVDLGGRKLLDLLSAAVDTISEARAGGGSALVYGDGTSFAQAVACAWLIARRGMTRDEAMEKVTEGSDDCDVVLYEAELAQWERAYEQILAKSPPSEPRSAGSLPAGNSGVVNGLFHASSSDAVAGNAGFVRLRTAEIDSIERSNRAARSDRHIASEVAMPDEDEVHLPPPDPSSPLLPLSPTMRGADREPARRGVVGGGE